LDIKSLLTPRKLLDGIWSIDGPANDLMYLITGTHRAMLVDTGMGLGDLAAIVHSLTDLPVTVINTHGHPDHAGGNGGFDEVWLDLQDEALMRVMTSDEFRLDDLRRLHDGTVDEYQRLVEELVPVQPYHIRPMHAGQVFDLGGRCFEVVPLPGHTLGSICLLNVDEKLLFSGDSIVATPVWMYQDYCTPLCKYLDSLRKILERESEFETIFPGHQPTPLDRNQLHELIACADEILANPGIGEPTKTFAGEGLLWVHGKGQIIYNLENLH